MFAFIILNLIVDQNRLELIIVNKINFESKKFC